MDQKATTQGPRALWPTLSQVPGAAVEQAVREALCDSLKALFARTECQSALGDDGIAAFLGQVRRGPIRPAVFGLYTDLVESLFSPSNTACSAFAEELLGLDFAREGTDIVSLTDEALGPGQANRYARLIDDDPTRRYGFAPLVRGFPDAAARTASALKLLDEGVPELAEEIRSIVREIVLVTDDSDGRVSESPSFEGASTFYLWGAIFLNVGHATRLDLAQAIAHEAAHLLLFGLMLGQPLTENDPSELYASPLRQDPRPMEGVVHAAYVLSRMSYTLERLLETQIITREERAEAHRQLANQRIRFGDAADLIARKARFRPGGEAIFRGAVEYHWHRQGNAALYSGHRLFAS